MSAMTDERLQWLLTTAKQVVSSDLVCQFVVGVTSDRQRRRYAYDRWAKQKDGTLDGFVILDWDLTADDVIIAERYLFEGLVMNEKYGTIETRYYPAVNRSADKHELYLAWWSPWLVVADTE